MTDPLEIDIETLPTNQLKDYVLVDIREADECKAIPPLSNDIHYKPMSQMEENHTFYTPGNKYLIYCAKGGRSYRVAEYLNHNGIKALSVIGGISALNQYLLKINKPKT